METIRQPQSYQLNRNGHMILSTLVNSYNHILISGDMQYQPKIDYLKPTAGLSGINFGADGLLLDNFTNSELTQIKETIIKLKILFSSIDYDPMFLFSIIENSAPVLKSSKPITFNLDNDRMDKKMPKESILLSAEDRMNSFKDWPSEFQRKTKEQLESSVIQEKTKLYQPQDQKKLTKPGVIPLQKKDDNFQLRTMKRPFVEKKPLPYIPHDNVMKILMALKKLVEENYDMQTLGKAFDKARNNIKKKVLHENYLWDLSKYANLYQRTEPNIGLSPKETTEIMEEIDKWIKIAIEHSDIL
jgi:hypothetical protein